MVPYRYFLGMQSYDGYTLTASQTTKFQGNY